MILTSVVPSDADAERIDLDDDGALQALAALYAPPRAEWLRLNLVSSVNGSAAGGDGTSDSLTNRADRSILRAIRSLADVVLVGAASVRAEGYHVPRSSRLAVLTGTGDLDGHKVRRDIEPGRLLVICPAGAVARVDASLDGAAAEIIVVDDVGGRIAPADVVARLRGRGLAHIVCEGGPSLAGQLLDAGIVDELCLSTGPVITTAQLPLFGSTGVAERRLELSQLLVDDRSGLYARWLVPRPAAV
ncbi:riboflavin biosynthesis pyrimidine reductase [Marisediminicola sp. UYEF4]|uniref:dihydrofolate reductase family protein n=1 Tax=Marisediminicola sp. UYEF4 TaxID=1756384 RepID=UPI0033971701